MSFRLERFFRENALFFILFALFMALSSAWVLMMPKGALLLWFSSHRSIAGDYFFRYATSGGEVVGFLCALIVLWRINRRWALALSAMTIAVSLVSNLTKSLLGQPRPARYFKETGMWKEIVPVPGIQVHEGLSSLPSGHTMAAFAFFSLMAFCLHDKRLGSILAFSAALVTGISRIYLVQHFEEDVMLGAAIGIILAMVFYHLFLPKQDKKLENAGGL